MTLRAPLLASTLLFLGISGPALAATQSFEKSDSYKNPAIKAGGSVSVLNLLGHVSLVPATDGVFSIDTKVVAAADSTQAAQELAGKVRFDVDADGNSLIYTAHYPLDEYTSYYYPRGSGFMLGMSTNSTTYMGVRVKVYDGSFGSGINLHVDFVIHVPKDVKVTVDNKIGKLEANGLNAAVELKSSSGDIYAQDNSGSLSADTGSGDITVKGHNGALDLDSGSGDVSVDHQKSGDIKVDTGSGDVTLVSLGGTLKAETGSGDLELHDFNGAGADLETGSGDIKLRDVTGSLKLSTGSGDIEGTGIKAGQAVECDTGSGGVDLDGDFSAVIRLMADTGSGDIVIHTSGVPSLHITATSDSGDVNVDLPGMQNVVARSHSIRADVNGAKGTAELEAGSGDVTFTKH